MVSFNVYRSTASGAYVEGVCLATDEKPVVGIANGSILFAVDTTSGETTRYMYDQNSMSWIEAVCPCGGGSGGGSGGGGGSSSGEGNLIVTLSGEDKTADKTCGEIESALAAGRSVYILGATGEESSYLPVVSCIYLTEPLEGYRCSYFSYKGKALKFNAHSPSATEYPSFAVGAD